MGIPNIYEMKDLPISHLRELVEVALNGQLEGVREKLDGQNFTFTLTSKGEVRFLGKGRIKSLVEKGGLDRNGLIQRFADKPKTLSDSFISAYDAIQSVCDSLDEDILSAFYDDEVIISTEILNPEHPNIVKYEQKRICIIEATDIDGVFDEYFFEDFVKAVDGIMSHGWLICRIPILQPKMPLGSYTTGAFLNELETIVTGDVYDINDVITDLSAEWIERNNISFSGVPADRLARRLAGNKSQLGRRGFQNSTDWETLKTLEKSLPHFEIRFPLENWVQRLGIAVMSRYDLPFTSPSVARAYQMRDEVSNIQRAFDEGRIDTDDAILRRIEVTLNRIDKSQLKRCAEGIVFNWKGRQMKLVGPFAPVNRLLGYFRYGKNPAQIVAPLMLFEFAGFGLGRDSGT